MFEHVGPPQYREFFRHCPNLLNEDGVMLLHTIGRLNEPGVTDPWPRKYIFPGGYCPSLSEITAASETNKLMVSDVEAIGRAHVYTSVTNATTVSRLLLEQTTH